MRLFYLCQILLKLEARTKVQQDYEILRSQKVLAKFTIILVAYLDMARLISGTVLTSFPDDDLVLNLKVCPSVE